MTIIAKWTYLDLFTWEDLFPFNIIFAKLLQEQVDDSERKAHSPWPVTELIIP